MRNRQVILILAAALVAFVFLTAEDCDNQDPTAKKEQQKQAQNYEGVVAGQPVHGMRWSPTREALNHWAQTWEEQGKLSYVYLLDAYGHKIGYYIFEGLPVSYCASLTPPDKVENPDFSSVPAVRAAPAIDGVYYSAANCQQLFGYDPISGAYLEFTGGGSFNYLLSDQPMTRIDTEPLGDATIEGVKKSGK